MGDLFHESVPFEFIDKVFELIYWHCEQHTFQILTKRPKQALKYHHHRKPKTRQGYRYWPENLWLGVTAENQEMADKRIPILLQIPAAVWFVSIEPMLEEIELPDHLHWVILGGESGPGARYCSIDNIRGIVQQCRAAGVAVFVKQIHLGTAKKFRLSKDINQFPEDLQIREYPNVPRQR
jgi:protein gp37